MKTTRVITLYSSLAFYFCVLYQKTHRRLDFILLTNFSRPNYQETKKPTNKCLQGAMLSTNAFFGLHSLVIPFCLLIPISSYPDFINQVTFFFPVHGLSSFDSQSHLLYFMETSMVSGTLSPQKSIFKCSHQPLSCHQIVIENITKTQFLTPGSGSLGNPTSIASLKQPQLSTQMTTSAEML